MSSGLWGVVVKPERARLRLRQGQWKRSPREEEERAPRPQPAFEERGRSRRRTPSRSAKRPGGRKMGEERPPEGSAVEQPGARRSVRPEQGKAKQVAVAEKWLHRWCGGAQRASLAEGHLGKELPPHSVYLGMSWGSHGNPGGWRNPFKAETRTEQSRAAVVLRYREYLRSPSGRWLRYRLHELVGKKCFYHCSLDEVCHVDEILKIMDDEQRARTRDDRPPDLGGMSLAEVGLALKSHLLAPRSEPAASVGNFVLRHSGLERRGISKDFLPFPLSFIAPPRLKYRSCWRQKGLNLARAGGTEVALDEYIQEAGLEAWTFLVTWALNFVYSGRHSERGERPETSWNSKNDMNAAQTQALAQLRKYIRGFLSCSMVPQLDWAGELASTRVDYKREEVKNGPTGYVEAIGASVCRRLGCVRVADLLEGWARACMEDPTKTLLPEDTWPDEMPEPQVWVESQKGLARDLRCSSGTWNFHLPQRAGCLSLPR